MYEYTHYIIMKWRECAFDTHFGIMVEGVIIPAHVGPSCILAVNALAY